VKHGCQFFSALEIKLSFISEVENLGMTTTSASRFVNAEQYYLISLIDHKVTQ
jgi:hypothetical protein